MKEKLVWISILSALAPMSSALATQWGEPGDLDEFIGLEDTRKRTDIVKTLQNIHQIDAIQKQSTQDGKLTLESELAERPWSGDFWPDLKGSIADPYAETGNSWVKRMSWGGNRDFLSKRTTLQTLAANPKTTRNELSDEKWNNMSPSEKYDLLIGDTNFTMTKQVIKMVNKLDEIHLTASFSGVCHGWGPASLTYPRPTHKVVLPSAIGGRPITFYPDDIKALSSFLWGKSPASDMVRFEGTKCYSGASTTKYGRMLDPKCFNVNPAFFHLVATNQIGLNGKGFIVDRTAGAQVWNHPVYKYKYSYFDITSSDWNAQLPFNKAKVFMRSVDRNISGTEFDYFNEFRSPKAKAIVGVRMEFFYAREDMDPQHRDTDDGSHDEWDSQVMHYSLELDDKDNIVGGEWHKYANPDARVLIGETVDCTKFRVPIFSSGTVMPCEKYTHPNSVWLVPPHTKAISPADVYLTGTWDGGSTPFPTEWRDLAIQYASKATIAVANPNTGRLSTVPAPQALGPVVDLLIEKSQTKQ